MRRPPATILFIIFDVDLFNHCIQEMSALGKNTKNIDIKTVKKVMNGSREKTSFGHPEIFKELSFKFPFIS